MSTNRPTPSSLWVNGYAARSCERQLPSAGRLILASRRWSSATTRPTFHFVIPVNIHQKPCVRDGICTFSPFSPHTHSRICPSQSTRTIPVLFTTLPKAYRTITSPLTSEPAVTLYGRRPDGQFYGVLHHWVVDMPFPVDQNNPRFIHHPAKDVPHNHIAPIIRTSR